MKRKEKTRKGFRLGYDRATQLQLHTLMLPGTVLMLLFSIVPLFGLLLAFKNYSVIEGIKGVFTSPWYGFQNFKVIFGNFDFKRMLVNTLGINLIGNLVNIVMAILFALFINEIARPRFKSFVQTVTYMPHFISWVVFGGIVITLLSGDGGLFNQILMKLGIISQPVVFMAQPRYFWAIAILSNLVKELGWSTILYTAAISGVDQELYQAADVDGANTWQKIVHVTVPGLLSTFFVLLLLAISNMLSNGFDQYWLLGNGMTWDKLEVFDTYVYRMGIKNMEYSLATAMGIFKSVVSIILLSFANWASRRLRGESIF